MKDLGFRAKGLGFTFARRYRGSMGDITLQGFGIEGLGSRIRVDRV